MGTYITKKQFLFRAMTQTVLIPKQIVLKFVIYFLFTKKEAWWQTLEQTC